MRRERLFIFQLKMGLTQLEELAMPYKEQLRETYGDCPGFLEKIEEINSILIKLVEKGFHKLVDNFLKNRSSYSSVPFLFEIFIARWISKNETMINVQYEPEIQPFKARPDFTFAIGEKNFVVSLKSIIQVSNEIFRRNIIKEIRRRFGDANPNIQIWLSPEIEAKDINIVVGWIVEKTKSLSVGDEDQYLKEEKTLATIKKLPDNQGKLMIEFIGTGPIDGPLPEIDTKKINKKLKSVIREAYSCFSNDDQQTYNFIFLTTDSYVRFVKELLEEVLWGTEDWLQHQGGGQPKFQRKSDGILSRGNFSKLDAIFFFHHKTDFLKEDFNPTVIINPWKVEKLQEMPEPFKGPLS